MFIIEQNEILINTDIESNIIKRFGLTLKEIIDGLILFVVFFMMLFCSFAFLKAYYSENVAKFICFIFTLICLMIPRTPLEPYLKCKSISRNSILFIALRFLYFATLSILILCSINYIERKYIHLKLH